MTDLTTILQLTDQLPRDDRIRLVQEVWDRLGDEGIERAPTEEDLALWQRRISELRADPEIAIRWEEIVDFVRRPE